jgi:hypothetical protein
MAFRFPVRICISTNIKHLWCFLICKYNRENPVRDEIFIALIFPCFNKTPSGVKYIP